MKKKKFRLSGFEARPLHHRANALPLKLQITIKFMCILFKLNHTAANGVFTEFYHINRT